MHDMLDVVIIGAGAAGLAAAHQLMAAGQRIVVLEARDRIGGRLWTRHDASWPSPIEMGPDFVHGRHPYLWKLLHSAKMRTVKLADRMWTIERGKRSKRAAPWDAVGKRLGTAPSKDVSVTEHIASLSEPARELARMFVEGFYASRPDQVSARWLATQESAGDDIDQDSSHRAIDGFGAVLGQLAEGVSIRFDHVVQHLAWRRGEVRVVASSKLGIVRDDVVARRAIVTVSPGVLKEMRFEPSLPRPAASAIAALHMGPVLKVALRFSDAFWRAKGFLGQNEEPQMMHLVNQPVRTFWTSHPLELPVITAWIAGARADALAPRSTDELVRACLFSLADGLGLPRAELLAKLEAWAFHDWQADPYARGAYAYVEVGHEGAPRTLTRAIDDTLIFAGEATSTDYSGTVHGALESGLRAATQASGTLG